MYNLIKTGLLAFICVSGMSIASPAQATTAPFVVFGDSLSDQDNRETQSDTDGNVTVIGSPFTNGEVWASLLGIDGDSGLNFAFAGAQATENGDSNFDFLAQITQFETAAPALDPEAWAVVWFGGNDILNAVANTLGPGFDPSNPDPGTVFAALAAASAAAESAIQSIRDGILALSTGPAAITNFLVPGLPDLGQLPQVAAIPGLSFFATLQTETFNENLQAALGTLVDTNGLNIEYFDIFGLFSDLQDNAPGNGFSIFGSTCLGDNADPICEGYLFWDDIHPTQAAHEILAEEFSQILPQAAIPLPAGAWLLIAGLGGLVVLRRRATQVAV